MERKEGRGRPGAPTSREQGRGKKESKEHQSPLSVWEVLERRVKVYTPDQNRSFSERVRQKKEVNQLVDGLRGNGTVRDRLIIDLYRSITIQPGYGKRSIRELSIEEFQQFRSQVEPLSDEETREKICKEEEEKQRKIEESKTKNHNRYLTLDAPKEEKYVPPDPSSAVF